MGIAFLGMRSASAAGVDLWGNPLAAGTGLVDACSSQAITVGYDVEYVPELRGYGVSAVNLTDIAPSCLGRQASVTLIGADGASMAGLHGAIVSTETSLAVPVGTPVSAEHLGSVSVVIAD